MRVNFWMDSFLVTRENLPVNSTSFLVLKPTNLFLGQVEHGTVFPILSTSSRKIDDSAKGGLTQFWELFTMIPCAPKYLKR